MDFYWIEPDQPRQRLGRLNLDLELPRPGEPAFGSNVIPTNISIASNASSILAATSESLSLSNVSDDNVSYSNNGVISLKVRRRRDLRVQFEGANLFRAGVTGTIDATIIRAASLPRSSPFVFERHKFGEPSDHVKLSMDKWPEPRMEPPYLEYEDVIYTLYHIPRYMYQKNKFRVGEFVLLVDDQPLLHGTIKKYGSTS